MVKRVPIPVAAVEAALTAFYDKDGAMDRALRAAFPHLEWANDDPMYDCTDFAHPAWWRAHEASCAILCAKVHAILDGEDDGTGGNHEPWGTTRRRLIELVKRCNTAEAHEQDVQAWAHGLKNQIADLTGAHGDPFPVGTKVRKVTGDYDFPGTVVASFLKLDGKRRYVVEDDRRSLHIFSAANLALRLDGE